MEERGGKGCVTSSERHMDASVETLAFSQLTLSCISSLMIAGDSDDPADGAGLLDGGAADDDEEEEDDEDEDEALSSSDAFDAWLSMLSRMRGTIFVSF